MTGKKYVKSWAIYMKKLLSLNSLLVLLVPILFLIISILTLSDYGMNWDSVKHFVRGQSYFNYIFTNKKNFLDMPTYPSMKGAPDFVDSNVDSSIRADVSLEKIPPNSKIRRSYFQSDYYTFDYFMTQHIHTHPEVNGLLIAFTNTIFYQNLGLVGDIEAYHLFVILVTFVLVAAIAVWTYNQFGLFISFIASSSLVLYPLVFAESHFNVKDPILMSFFGLAIISFWLGFSNKKVILIILSAVFAGFALGTKFNALFLPLILGPWVIFDLFRHYKKEQSLLSLIGGSKILITLLIYPLIMLLILYIFSPYLWQDPIGRFMEIFNYYKSIGTEPLAPEMSRFLVRGWNIYPIVWIFYTTPLPILFLSLVGISYSLFLFLGRKSEIAFLILLWLTVPIVRVVWPGANIYGGVRQIMEFIPAMAILSGMGAFFLIHLKWNQRFISIFITASLLFVVNELISIHPNENVYFNQLAGGLSGAYEKKIPSWGNSYGNVYLQGIEWLNKNTETDAKLALPINYISSIPRLKLRGDIDLDNHYFSGQDRRGEYAMEMYYDWPLIFRYRYAYYNIFLEPVYQVKVDGVPLLKIWKNDLLHTKVGFEEEKILQPTSIKVEEQKIVIDFPSQVFLTKLVINHSSYGCESDLGEGFIAISDDGINFVRISDPLVDPEYPESTPGMDETTFIHLFAATPANSLIFNSRQDNSCILKDFQVKIMGLNK